MDRDHNRSNDTGTGAKALDRDSVQDRSDAAGIAAEPQPRDDSDAELIADADSADRADDSAAVPPRRA